MRDPLSRRRAPNCIWGPRRPFCYSWRDHIAVKGPRFPFEITEFRVKTFFFGDHLVVNGTKIPFKGPEFWVKTFFSFLETITFQRSARGPHWGKLPTSNCKAFSLKISTKSLTVDPKKAIQKTELHFILGSQALSCNLQLRNCQIFLIFSFCDCCQIFKISALEITVYTPITVAKQCKLQKKTPRKGH